MPVIFLLKDCTIRTLYELLRNSYLSALKTLRPRIRLSADVSSESLLLRQKYNGYPDGMPVIFLLKDCTIRAICKLFALRINMKYYSMPVTVYPCSSTVALRTSFAISAFRVTVARPLSWLTSASSTASSASSTFFTLPEQC